jgi:hypothetical protein
MTPMVLTLVDAQGVEWFAAAYVDTLKSNGRTVELVDAEDMAMVITDMRVVRPPAPRGVNL